MRTATPRPPKHEVLPCLAGSRPTQRPPWRRAHASHVLLLLTTPHVAETNRKNTLFGDNFNLGLKYKMHCRSSTPPLLSLFFPKTNQCTQGITAVPGPVPANAIAVTGAVCQNQCNKLQGTKSNRGRKSSLCFLQELSKIFTTRYSHKNRPTTSSILCCSSLGTYADKHKNLFHLSPFLHKNSKLVLASVAWLVRALSHKLEGRRFDSPSGYVPRLQVRSPVGAHTRGK